MLSPYLVHAYRYGEGTALIRSSYDNNIFSVNILQSVFPFSLLFFIHSLSLDGKYNLL